jgi:hypothetical protein
MRKIRVKRRDSETFIEAVASVWHKQYSKWA